MAETARMVDQAVPVVLAFGRAEAEGAQSRRGEASARPRPAEGLIGLEAGDRRLTARLVGGEFINYASRFPGAFDCHAEIPAGPLIAAVRRAALVAGRLDPVRLTFRADQVVIEAQSEGRARAAETVSAEFSGDKPVMSFSPHYLLDGLVAAASGQPGAAAPHPREHDEGDEETGEAAVAGEGTEVPGRIRLEFTDPAKPALITAVGDGGLTDIPAYRYLVVPMRVPARG
jgi:DNA polymerase-3 subunit beta